MAIRRVRLTTAVAAATPDAAFSHIAEPDWSALGFIEDPKAAGEFGFPTKPGAEKVSVFAMVLDGLVEDVSSSAATVSLALVARMSFPMTPGGSTLKVLRQLAPADLGLGDLGIEFDLPAHTTRLYPRIVTGLAAAGSGADFAVFMGDFK